MLTRDLLRYRIEDGRIVPGLLRATPAMLQQAEELLEFWRQGVGQQRGTLEDAAVLILQRHRGVVVARGLQKLILEQCLFREPEAVDELRSRAFTQSAHLLKRPAISADEHRNAVAASVGMSGEALALALYGDLPDAMVLEKPCPLTPRRLIEIYNLAICQGLLLNARELEVTIHDQDVGLRRKVLKGMRFRRLLAQVNEAAAGELTLSISGPGSVLDQAGKYGLQLALFLPVLACARTWTARARIMIPARFGSLRSSADLELTQQTGIVGDSNLLGYVPEELRTLQCQLVDKFPGWEFPDAPVIPVRSGEIIVPDLAISAGKVRLSIELFHRWHGHALARRLEQIAAGHVQDLALGVERALAKSAAVAPLLTHQAFLRHGFLFSSMPSVRAISEIVGRCAS